MYVKDVVGTRETILGASRGQSEKQWVEGARTLIFAQAEGKKLSVVTSPSGGRLSREEVSC